MKRRSGKGLNGCEGVGRTTCRDKHKFTAQSRVLETVNDGVNEVPVHALLMLKLHCQHIGPWISNPFMFVSPANLNKFIKPQLSRNPCGTNQGNVKTLFCIHIAATVKHTHKSHLLVSHQLHSCPLSALMVVYLRTKCSKHLASPQSPSKSAGAT